MEEMSDELASWINQELITRSWSVHELARRAKLAHATINDVLSGKTKPGLKFCLGIAEAFQVQDVEVLRRAHLIKPEPPTDTPVLLELLHYVAQLNEEDQKQFLKQIKASYEYSKKERKRR